jgi:hypothetical protein
MLVTLLGIVTEVKPLQSKKALSPMLVTLLGIVTEVKLPQPKKALLPILVTPLFITTLFIEALAEYQGDSFVVYG